MFVGSAEEDVNAAVELAVPLRAVVVRAVPWRINWDDVVGELVEFAVALPAIVVVLSPKIVVEPRVVLFVEDPLVIIETIADVAIGEEVGIVTVEEYDK